MVKKIKGEISIEEFEKKINPLLNGLIDFALAWISEGGQQKLVQSSR